MTDLEVFDKETSEMIKLVINNKFCRHLDDDGFEETDAELLIRYKEFYGITDE